MVSFREDFLFLIKNMSNATLVRILDYPERLTLDDGIYIFKIKTLVDNLVAIEEPVAKKDQILLLVGGLGANYNSMIASLIAHEDDLPIQSVHGILLTHEQKLCFQNSMEKRDNIFANVGVIEDNIFTTKTIIIVEEVITLTIEILLAIIKEEMILVVMVKEVEVTTIEIDHSANFVENLDILFFPTIIGLISIFKDIMACLDPKIIPHLIVAIITICKLWLSLSLLQMMILRFLI